MKRHLDEELENLRKKIFSMGLLVEKQVDLATASLFERDSDKAKQVKQGDQEINLCEIEVDELGHELIALYQPAAVDLRFITMVLKVNNDLERMGDQAVNIAEKALVINQELPLKAYEELLPKMAEAATRMVRDSLNAFMERDPDKAKAVLESDDAIDELNHKVYDDIQKVIQENPDYVRTGIGLIMVSHNLERIADLATNIAEDVIYLKRGVDVRHHIRERRNP